MSIMNTKQALLQYIKALTGWEMEVEEKENPLPLYLRSGYTFWYAKIASLDLVFAYAKEKKPDIRLHMQAYRALKERLGEEVVFVFGHLDTRQINSLIQKRIPFIVPGKYLYLPFAMMQIGTSLLRKPTAYKNERLTPDADLILVGYLDARLHNGMMIKEIASAIGREIRSTSAALSLLYDLGYLDIEKEGRSKRVRFETEPAVYQRWLKEGLPPQKRSFFTASESVGNQAVKSGYSALATYTRLLETGTSTVAVSEKSKNLLSALNVCEEDEALYKVEVWDRDPHTFAYQNTVSPIYLLRQFKDDDDERIHEALKEIEKSMKERWSDG